VQGYRFNYLPVEKPFQPNIFASRVGEHGVYQGTRYWSHMNHLKHYYYSILLILIYEYQYINININININIYIYISIIIVKDKIKNKLTDK
jgi:hypothetical protein